MKDALFQQYAAVVENHFGIKLPRDKMALLESRLFKLFNDNEGRSEYENAEAFLKYIHQDKSGKALAKLAEAITAHHTYFMSE